MKEEIKETEEQNLKSGSIGSSDNSSLMERKETEEQNASYHQKNDIKKKNSGMDMLNGSLADKILLFALPLGLSSILQQLFNSVDVAIAGRFAGNDALAAVGANSALIAVFVNLFVGLSVGANVVIATLIGQKKKEEVPTVVHTVILLAIICGVGLLILGQLVARPILELMGTPEDALDLAVLYLKIYFLGMPFILLYNFGAAVLRSVGDTKRPMMALIIAGFINTGLNMLLVIVFHMGVAGVAIATVFSNVVSSAIVIVALLREEEMIRLHISKLRINKRYLVRVITVGAPAGIQGMVFSLSNVFVQSGINSFGLDAVAGSSTGLNFEYFSFGLCNAFAQAAVTFASQNYGAGQIDRCRKICRICLIEGFLCTELLSLLFIIFAEPLVHLYTPDENVTRFAISRMMHVVALEGMTGIYEIPGGTMRGMGHSLLPAILTIIGTVGFRIVWLYTIFEKVHTFEMLMNVYPASWVFNSIMMLTAYFVIMKKLQKKKLER